jgi:uncharacterized membrane protein YccC
MSIKKYDDFNILLYKMLKIIIQSLIIAFVALLIQDNKFNAAKLFTLTILIVLIIYIFELLSNRYNIVQNSGNIGLQKSNPFMLL